MNRALTFLFVLLLSGVAMAQELPLPRFAALKSDKVYMRAGPGERFPIEWVFEKKSYPVEIIDSFEYWRKIRDVDNTQGWIHQRMFTGKRTLLTPADKTTILYKRASTSSPQLALLKGRHILHIIKCKAQESMCHVRYNDLKGYVLRDDLFGIYPYEEVKD